MSLPQFTGVVDGKSYLVLLGPYSGSSEERETGIFELFDTLTSLEGGEPRRFCQGSTFKSTLRQARRRTHKTSSSEESFPEAPTVFYETRVPLRQLSHYRRRLVTKMLLIEALRMHDANPVGWITTLGYLIAAALCVYRKRDLNNVTLTKRFWGAAGIFVIALALNKQLDLQTLLTDTLRNQARHDGW